MKKIRVVQIGTWKMTHAEHTLMSMLSMPEIYDVIGICEPNPERKKLAQSRKTYKNMKWLEIDEVLNDGSIDAVIIETHENEQLHYSIMFAERGFNIHVDKPCGGSIEQFIKLKNIIEKNKTVFQIGYMYRYNPAILKAYELYKNGTVGSIISIEAQMSQNYNGYLNEFLGDLNGGMMYYLGCHLVDLIYMFQGKPDYVLPNNTYSNIDSPVVKDHCICLFKYANGISFAKTVANEIGGNMRRYFFLSGTKGSIEIDPIEQPTESEGITNANTASLILKTTDSVNNITENKFFFDAYGRYDDMMIDFARCVADKNTDKYDIEYEYELFKLLNDACK